MKTMTAKICAMIAPFALFLAPAAQALTVDELVGGQLQGTFELDLDGFGGGGGPTSWTAIKQ